MPLDRVAGEGEIPVVPDPEGEANDSIYERVDGHRESRVLRVPFDVRVQTFAEIGDHAVAGQTIAQLEDHFVSAALNGMLRGPVGTGLPAKRGMRTGALDPRDDPALYDRTSDKSRAAGGSVWEAIRSRFDLRDFA